MHINIILTLSKEMERDLQSQLNSKMAVISHFNCYFLSLGEILEIKGRLGLQLLTIKIAKKKKKPVKNSSKSKKMKTETEVDFCVICLWYLEIITSCPLIGRNLQW